ncbi:MAG: HDOD domain-containing protein [Deltaproteobacteria bacterium]|nr:HDOD domain-containing protein [Deltaproteobacteria bacterium]
MKYRILFVDDELNVLNGLRRMLRPMRDIWEMSFAVSGEQALKLMKIIKFEVIVSDMRMPEMNGAELLTEVMKLYPETVRIVLSGHSDIELVLKSILPAHQYLSKPCDGAKLKDVVERALGMSRIISNETVKKLISQIETLPVLPSVYNELLGELNNPDSSMKEIGYIISKDVGMSAKIMKLVNSSFFGFARHISSTEQAVNLIGLNILKSLILYEHIFSVFEQKSMKLFSFEMLWEHCLRVGKISRIVSETCSSDKEIAEDSFIAGMLHDVGKLIMGANFTAQYSLILNKVKKEERLMWDVETEIMGTTHAEVGAYLLGLWGLTEPVVEAIAFHHAPYSPSDEFRPLTAVYIANHLDHEMKLMNEVQFERGELDMKYLGKIGVDNLLDEIREKVVPVLEEKNER